MKGNAFTQKLQPFYLKPIEREIIRILYLHDQLTIAEISEYMAPQFTAAGPFFYKILKSLYIDGWLIKIQNDPIIYSLNSKTALQTILDKIIAETQENLKLQKESYNDILSALDETFSESTPEIELKSLIPSTTPNYFQRIVKELLNTISCEVSKLETNVIVDLRNENLKFRLNFIEFEQIVEENVYYTGLTFSEVKKPSNTQDLLARLHHYHIDGLKFQYKLEASDFFEYKQRGLENFNIDEDNVSSKGNKYSNKFYLEFSTTSCTGIISTKKNSLNEDDSILFITIFAETRPLFTNLEKKTMEFFSD